MNIDKFSLSNYEKLYFSYSKTLNSYLRRKYPLLSFLLIEDIVQDTFLVVYEKLLSINPKLNFFNWIVTISINKIKDYIRKEKRYVFFSENFDHDFEFIDQIEKKELEEKVDIILNKLPPISRQVIVLYYFKNMKINDIAKLLNKNLNTIKTILKRAKEFLKTKKEIINLFDFL